MKAACAYAVVQFRPFVETGEFANVGIVMLGVEQRFFEFQLLTKYRRVTQFFPELERKVYLDAMAGFRDELERVRALLKKHALADHTTPDAALAEHLFVELTRTREGLLRFDAPRLVLADDPQAKFKELFDHYLGRNFVTKEYQERLLENHVARLLNRAHFQFAEGKVGNDDFVVRFPFVRRDNEVVTDVIKPLFLGQADTTRILTKGDNWISKVKRLRRLNRLPANVLFALNAPPVEAKPRFRAYNEIADELKGLGVVVTEASNDQAILGFAAQGK